MFEHVHGSSGRGRFDDSHRPHIAGSRRDEGDGSTDEGDGSTDEGDGSTDEGDSSTDGDSLGLPAQGARRGRPRDLFSQQQGRTDPEENDVGRQEHAQLRSACGVLGL